MSFWFADRSTTTSPSPLPPMLTAVCATELHSLAPLKDLQLGHYSFSFVLPDLRVCAVSECKVAPGVRDENEREA